MSVNLELLTRPFPPEAIHQRRGPGGKMLPYLCTHTVIRRLNEATGNCWDFIIERLEWRGDLLICVGMISIPDYGCRQGIGVQRVTEGSGEDLIKGAASDALKKAATLYGVGQELYGPDYEDAAAETASPSAACAQKEPPGAPVGGPILKATAQAIVALGKDLKQYGYKVEEWSEDLLQYGGFPDLRQFSEAEGQALLEALRDKMSWHRDQDPVVSAEVSRDTDPMGPVQEDSRTADASERSSVDLRRTNR